MLAHQGGQLAITKHVCFSSLIFSDWVQFEDNIYKVFQERKNWIVAESYCVGWGGHLASISSIKEQSFIHELLKESSDNAVWIGLNDRKHEGRYEWTDGTSVVYEFWNSGDPNNGGKGEGEDCVEISQSNGRWNATNCAVQNWFACKKSNTKGITSFAFFCIAYTNPSLTNGVVTTPKLFLLYFAQHPQLFDRYDDNSVQFVFSLL